MKSPLRICPQCGTETTAATCRHDGFGTVDAARYRKSDPTQLIGTLFQDRYRVDAVLGSGGMGSVFRATQVRVGRQVALKVINAELAYDLAVVARFQREGRAIASLIHPNIVQVYDFGQTDDGQLFMAMELVAGHTLAHLIQNEAPLDPSRVVHIGGQIFDALAEAHERGVVHRDLKPDNIFVTDTGRRRDSVKILDFGVAKIVNEPQTDSMVTARGAILGSPRYMAPEQARGKGVTGHADLYAVGGILYELLTGRPVFNEPSPADYLIAHAVKLPGLPEAGGRELQGPLVDLIMRCLEKKPWNRPDGAAKALEMIEACRLTPLVEPGDNAPLRVRDIPPDQDLRPRRLVRHETVSASRPQLPIAAPPPIPAEAEAEPIEAVDYEDDSGDEEEEEYLRPRVVAPGLVKRPEGATAGREVAAAAPAAIDTRRVGQRGAAGEESQDHPTIIGEGQSTDQSLHVVRLDAGGERRRRYGTVLMLAALALIFGAVLVLAEGSLFRGSQGPAASVGLGVNIDRVTAEAMGPGTLEETPNEAGPSPAEATAAVTSPEAPAEGDQAPAAGASAIDLAVVDLSAEAPEQDEHPAEAPALGSPSPRVLEPAVERQARPVAERAARTLTPPAEPAPAAAPRRIVPEIAAPAREAPALAPAPEPAPAASSPVRRVLVSSEPSGAEVMMGSLPLGRTPIYVEVKESGQRVAVTVRKEGFAPQRATIGQSQDQLKVTLTPGP